MPDRRKHRGQHPEDAGLFGTEALCCLQNATHDLSWLLSHGYADKSALKLVGDRYQLTARQRMAVLRSAAAEENIKLRKSKEVSLAEITGATICIDGFNLITTIETALGGGVVLRGRDACWRDIAGIHGTYRKVNETIPAIDLIAAVLNGVEYHTCNWYLDRPVSNSGRLKNILLDQANRHDWPWNVEVVSDPDRILSNSPDIVVTSDSVILDRCQNWLNLADYVLKSSLPEAFMVNLL